MNQNYRFRICVQGDTKGEGYMIQKSGYIYKIIQICGHETLAAIGPYNVKVLPITGNNGDQNMLRRQDEPFSINELDLWYTYNDPHQTADDTRLNCKGLTFKIFEGLA